MKMCQRWSLMIYSCIIIVLLTACEATSNEAVDEGTTVNPIEVTESEIIEEDQVLESNYTYEQELKIIEDKYRNYYEIFVYSYYDSNGDGIGDLEGIRSKLDYINDGDDATDEDLGFNGIWLMPIMPSTTYHKYDVTDYYDIDPDYGTLEDFQSKFNFFGH